MLTEAQCDALEVVLVSPRNPLNIGAAARAMANFGFRRLKVVAPFAPMWQEARSAVGAGELLANAESTECLAEAVSACTLVVGTGTLTYRRPELPVVVLPLLAPLLRQELARGGRVGLVFGSEKHGLTREDLSYCHMMAEIPTGAGQPSMNLGQAVAVCLYELAAGEGRGIHQKSPDGTEGLPYTEADRSKAEDGAAASQGLERVAGVIEETMRAAGYSPKTMQAANRHDLRLTLRRLKLSAHDARRILGLFRRILWRLKHFPARDDKSN